jgi:polar amino acid transport system ATP-binding protein
MSMQEQTPLLWVDRVSASYGATCVVDEVSVELKQGETLCVIGPSGSGKSTLLRCINGLVPLTSGRVLLDGEMIGYELRRGKFHRIDERALNEQRRHIGMVFQNFNLFPHLSVMDNLTLAPRMHRMLSSEEAESRGLALLETVGLKDKADAYPRQLSGGQQQRVAIARALILEPRLMLFDEPTSALDAEAVRDVLAVMKDLAAGGMSMVVVTHELRFASEAADHMLFMDGGRVIHSGPPGQVLGGRDNPRLERFLHALA